MAKTRRPRPLIPIVFGLVLLVGLIGGIWLTWPSDWVPEAPPSVEGPRVGPEERPRWTRSWPELPRVRGVPAPPVSRFADVPAEDTGLVLDTAAVQPGPAMISGWMLDAAGTNVGGGSVGARCESGVGDQVVSNRRMGEVDGSGWFEIRVTAPADCVLVGMRADGLLITRSEPVELYIEPGEEVEVDLVVPVERTGGIGVQFREHPDGIRVEKVHEGTPAWQAGLQAGDIIVEVDGVPAVDLDQQGFIGRMTGPEGTKVDFVIAYEEDGELVEESRTVTRQFLERDLLR